MSAEQIKNDEELDDDFEFEIEDDTPESDRGRSRASDDTDDDDDDIPDEEMEKHSAGVQKRLKTLTRQKHDERRAKEAKERELTEAVSVIEKLKAQLRSAAGTIVNSSKSQFETELSQARAELAEAIDLGDGKKVAELTDKVAQVRTKLDGAINAEKQIEHEVKNPPQPQSDPNDQSKWPKARQTWAKKNNDWFHKDRKMTAFAYGVHQELVLDKGYQPDSQEYFDAIDEEMSKQFPKYFAANEDDEEVEEEVKPRRATQKAVNFDGSTKAPTSSGGGKKKVIKLTTRQMDLCNRLGITPKQYVEEYTKLENN